MLHRLFTSVFFFFTKRIVSFTCFKQINNTRILIHPLVFSPTGHESRSLFSDTPDLTCRGVLPKVFLIRSVTWLYWLVWIFVFAFSHDCCKNLRHLLRCGQQVYVSRVFDGGDGQFFIFLDADRLRTTVNQRFYCPGFCGSKLWFVPNRFKTVTVFKRVDT